MYHLNIPLIIVFMLLAAVSGLIAFYCWYIIQKHWIALTKSNPSRGEDLRSRFTVIIMIVPLLGFSFEFVYFFLKSLQELWLRILK
jgi:hypothetical protein